MMAKGLHRAWRTGVVGALALLWAASGALASESAAPDPEPSPVSYASVSDEELTAIAARWDDLDAQQRRALLSEVKGRMKRKGTAQGVLRIKVRRRYGTVVRHPNGATATLRIEVRSMRKGRRDFGVGFENRAGQEGKAPQKESAESGSPVIRVAEPDE